MTTSSTQDQDTQPREFAAFLLETNKGRSHAELTRALAALVADVQRSGKPGSLTYKLTVKPQPGNEQMVIVVDQIVAKAPAAERASSVFFIDDDHGLVRNDPRQRSIFDN